MKALYSYMHPEIEAHLFNSSDWLRRDDTIQLGCYSEHDVDEDTWEHYVLYAVETANGISLGAHYGDDPSDYLSSPLFTEDDPLHYVSGCVPLTIARVRYMLLNQEREHDYFDQRTASRPKNCL